MCFKRVDVRTVKWGEDGRDWKVGSYQVSNRNHVFSLVSEKTLKVEERKPGRSGSGEGPGFGCCL